MNKINEYEINENITTEKLLQSGFANDNSDYWQYRKNIYNGVILNVFIPINTNKTNEEDTHSDISRPFNIFYTVLENPGFKTSFDLDRIIDNYNIEMDNLTTKEILKHKEKENIKVKKRVK